MLSHTLISSHLIDLLVEAVLYCQIRTTTKTIEEPKTCRSTKTFLIIAQVSAVDSVYIVTVSRFQVVNYLPSSARQVTNQRETEGIGMAFWNRNKPVKCTPQGYVGHMRHISFLAGTPPDDNVIVHCGALIERILLDMKAKKASSMTFNEYVHIIHQSEYLQLSLLVNTIIPKVVAAYPYVDSGFRWDIEVKEIYQWPEGYQGLICGVCRGVRVCLFDCFFFKNAGRYCSGVTTSFALIAIAYSELATILIHI